MENYNKNVTDITYKAELTPHPVTVKRYYALSGCGVKFAHITYSHLCVRKLCAH